MLNASQLHAMHEKLFGLMHDAGWLHDFFFSQDEGWRLVWTEPGAQRAALLKIVIETQRLHESDRAPVAFTVRALGGTAAGTRADTDQGVLRFWQHCCEEVGLAAIAGECLVFVRIILN